MNTVQDWKQKRVKEVRSYKLRRRRRRRCGIIIHITICNQTPSANVWSFCSSNPCKHEQRHYQYHQLHHLEFLRWNPPWTTPFSATHFFSLSLYLCVQQMHNIMSLFKDPNSCLRFLTAPLTFDGSSRNFRMKQFRLVSFSHKILKTDAFKKTSNPRWFSNVILS